MARDDRPWGGSQPPAVVYSYAPGRGHTHANALLGGYRGILQCDGYAAYKKFAGSKSAETAVTLAFCWSHVRRGFYDLAKAKAPIAMETLQRIAALYEIEARVRGKSAADRLAVRQAESKPLVAELRDWFEAQLAKLPARGPTADAIRYALNHWDGLERFLEDGRIELDTNSVERAMRPVCLSRKNSLFAGSDVGASYCPSGDVLIKSADFAEDREISGVLAAAATRHHGARHPVAGQRAGLSRAPQRTAAARESRRWSPFGRLSLGSPSGFRQLRRG
jgi:hypothetical protein